VNQSVGSGMDRDSELHAEPALNLIPPVRPLWAAALKRCLDVVGASLGLLLLFPLLLIIAVLVKVQDGGPVLYRRNVIGREGPFDAFKFRSMNPAGDAMLQADPVLRNLFEQNFKLKNDPRVTRMGSFLRKYSLDELPQLLNVFVGQMSLVGPRMITAEELERYGVYRQLVLSVRPGLTGYWQVNGRQQVAYSQRVEMDVLYIQHWSLGFDLRILLQTPQKVLKGEGAF
jgi:lipopolysaccharide/colanic/teichoic acid biosynthesis glycosyltransferase